MLVSEILHTLPATLEWMVLFNLSAIRQFADGATTRAMYHLSEEIDLEPYSHVVLTSFGRFLALHNESKLIEPLSGKGWSREQIKSSLHERFASRIALFPVDEADCLGLGEQSPFSPVLLHIKIKSGYGEAQAIFERSPSVEHYELLRAVGVKFLGGELKGEYYLAQFQNRLPIHIHAGILSHFSRTAHCNLFFLQHGNIDPLLEAGLLTALTTRVNYGIIHSLQALAKLAQQAVSQPMAMTCQPPPPDKPFPYGDLVPLGFVLKALNAAESSVLENQPTILKARQAITRIILSNRQGNLWAFHTDRLITSTDSTLILQGLNEPFGVEALEIFADGQGGYYPQLWSSEKQPGKMVFDESCRHWCQSDYATTCLVRALRKDAGLESKTSTDYLAAGFENRSGLYFANPYLVDWVLACAISFDESAAQLRQKLLAEILASMNEDYSFGVYDVAMSTALAILSMAALGFKGRTMQVAQLRLLEFIDSHGLLPAATPFYSSLRIDNEISSHTLLGLLMSQTAANTSGNQQKQIRKVEEQYHGISLYVDTHQMITTALAALALLQKCSHDQQDLDLSSYKQEVHPRYQCLNHCEYITKFALPPYI
ncbi:MAG: hypothetical protein DSM106950_12790 [Stigonema ocellatum SAG 48.90 = DSM 106950]|nr:hypothetical protein [Stigonema ocellatum SAG 48.90 = DSM 106950]